MARTDTLHRLVIFLSLAAAVLASSASSLAADGPDDELTKMVVDLLGDKDKEMRAVGLEQVRTAAKGEATTRRFAEQLPRLVPDAQTGLLSALADRGDKTARPAVLAILEKTDEESVKVAAIEALGLLGEPADLDQLIPLLVSKSKAQQRAARQSLVRLSGDGVSTALAGRLKQSPADVRVALIDVLTTRRATVALPELLAAAIDTDPVVRRAAMTSLADLADREQLAGMLQGVLKATPGPEREAAERAVATACQRISPSEDPAAPLVVVIDKLNESERVVLLPALGRVGGSTARQRIEAAIAQPKLREAGIRGLCNWPNASIAPVLIKLLENENTPKQRAVLLAGLIRMAPLPDDRPDADRLALLQTTMELCANQAERQEVLRRARAIRTIETLRFVLPYLDQPDYAQIACETVVELAHHRGLREPNKAEFDQALDKVIATSRDEVVIDRAKRYQRGQTWTRPAAAKPE